MIYQITQKLNKLARFQVAKRRTARSLPLFWHIGQPNFGDDINPSFYKLLCRNDFHFQTNRSELHGLGMGSILHSANGQSVVLGSGMIGADFKPKGIDFQKVHMVRGELTKRAIGLPETVAVADPMVLLSEVWSAPKLRSHRIGYVPHVSNYLVATRFQAKGIFVINPAWDPWRVVASIADCEFLLSQSLHGLIVADALQIPNAWVMPSQGMVGGRFKFDDYYTTVDQQKEPISEKDIEFQSVNDFFVSEYRFDKKMIRELIASAVNGWVVH